MPWIRLDDQFPDHPKTVAAGPMAAWLFVCGIGYCNRLLTDGVIPTGQVRKLADVDNAMELAARLVEVGLWEAVEGGYRVHDFLDYQPSAEQVKAERVGNAQRQQEWRERQKDKRNGVSNAVTAPVSNAPRNGPVTAPPYPIPYPSPFPTKTQPVEDVKTPPTPTPIRPPAEPVAPPHGGERARESSPLPAAHAARFDAFWDAYPKKVGKKSCAAWWDKRRPSADLTQTILDSVAAHKLGDQWQRSFIKDPIRWLQEERWNDEVPPAPIASLARSPATTVTLEDGTVVGAHMARVGNKYANIDLGVKQC